PSRHQACFNIATPLLLPPQLGETFSVLFVSDSVTLFYFFFFCHIYDTTNLLPVPLPPIYIVIAVVLQLGPSAKVIHSAHWYHVAYKRGRGLTTFQSHLMFFKLPDTLLRTVLSPMIKFRLHRSQPKPDFSLGTPDIRCRLRS